jgi:hypothetical protein
LNVELDHLVVAAATLEQGEAFLAERTGARAVRGGKHPLMGTHNSLLKLDARTYIEIIAVDPEASPPARPRWFALDTPAMRAALAESPRLIHWAVRCDDIDTVRAACRVDPGPAQQATRAGLRWRITIPVDGSLPAGGVLPTLIAWEGAAHPTDTLPESGLRLATLAAAHPAPAMVREALGVMGLSDVLRVTYEATPRLAAMLHTRQGPIAL